MDHNQRSLTQPDMLPRRSSDRLFLSVIGAAAALALATLALYAAVGSGPVLAVLPWFNPLGFTFMALTSVSIAFLAVGRFQVLQDAFSYWTGIGFAVNAIGLLFYVLAWPGLLPDGRAFIARLPNTAGFLVTVLQVVLGAFYLAALWPRRPEQPAEPAHIAGRLPRRSLVRPLAAWSLFFTALYGLMVVFEARLPSMVRADGSYSPILLAANVVSVGLFAASMALAVRRYRRTGDALIAYILFSQLVMLFAVFVTLIGQKRYDLWWYLARAVLMGGYSIVLFGMLSQFGRLIRQVQDSETRYRYLNDSLPQLVVTFKPGGSLNYASQQWLAYTGAEERPAGAGWMEIIHPDDRERVSHLWQAALAAGERVNTEMRLRSKDGLYRWFNAVLLPVRGAEGQVTEWFGSFTDIEDIKASEAALRESERHQRALSDAAEIDRARLATTLENLPVGVWVAGADGQLIEKNNAADRIWAGDAPLLETVDRYTEYAAWFADSGRALTPEDYPVARALRTGRPVAPVELKIRRLDGTTGVVLASAAPIIDAGGRLTGVVGINMDITDRKQAEEARLKQEIRNQVHHRLMDYREQERQQVARELHDEPLQDLLAINMQLSEVIARAGEDQRAPLEAIQALALKTVNQIGAISFYLRPPVLMHMGLEKALLSYIDVFEERHPGLRVQFRCEDEYNALAEPIRLAIYRVVQELLNNAGKHSRASEVEVALRTTLERVTIEVRDNGVGFEPPGELLDLARSGHYGIVDVMERLEMLNGVIEIDSSPGAGTRIVVTVPLDGTAGAQAA